MKWLRDNCPTDIQYWYIRYCNNITVALSGRFPRALLNSSNQIPKPSLGRLKEKYKVYVLTDRLCIIKTWNIV